MKAQQNAPFGDYAPPAWCKLLIRLCQHLPTRTWLGKRIAFICRKPVLLRKQSPVDISSHGLKFRLYPKQNLSDKRLLCNPDLLDGIERDYFTKSLSKEAVVLDVGANIGGYGLLLAASRPDIKVFCIEASPELAQRLNQHIAFNSLENRCRCFQVAASTTDGAVELFLDQQNQGQNSLDATFIQQNSSNKKTSVSVPALTLQSIIEKCDIKRVNLLKMDIEGFEFPVLKQFFETSEKALWPDFIQLEQHRQTPDNQAVQLAKAKGYQLIFQTRMNVVLSL